MSSAAALARPGTPFPSTESISYFSHTPAPTPSTWSRQLSMNWNTHPIHFQIPARPVLTPPSLLQRTSSSGSSSSFHLSRTPSAGASASTAARRFSTSGSSDCASSVSSPMPATPISSININETIVEESDIEEMALAPPASPSTEETDQFELTTSPSPSPKGSKGFASNFVYNFNTISSTLPPLPTKSATMPPPSRPTLKRRDTPRPKADVLSMAPLRPLPTLSPVDENLPKRRFTSMVDGGSWMVVA